MRPDMVLGNFHSQVACANVGAACLLEFMDEFGLERLEPLSDLILSCTQKAMRESIRALAPGVYEYEIVSDGFSESITLRVRCEVIEGEDEIRVDYFGSRRGPHNGRMPENPKAEHRLPPDAVVQLRLPGGGGYGGSLGSSRALCRGSLAVNRKERTVCGARFRAPHEKR